MKFFKWYGLLLFKSNVKKNEIEIIELKDEDIRDFALEAINIFEKNYKLSEEEQYDQKNLKKFLINHTKFKHLRTSKNKK